MNISGERVASVDLVESEKFSLELVTLSYTLSK